MLNRYIVLFVTFYSVRPSIPWSLRRLHDHQRPPRRGRLLDTSCLYDVRLHATEPFTAARKKYCIRGTSRLDTKRKIQCESRGRSPSSLQLQPDDDNEDVVRTSATTDRQQDWSDGEEAEVGGAWVTYDEAEKEVIFDPIALDDEGATKEEFFKSNDAGPPAAGPDLLLGLQPSSSTDTVSYFYLKNELGMSEEAMWRITFEAGSALGMTASTLRRKVDLLRTNLNLSPDDVRLVLERQPTILQLSADKNLAPTILFLVRALDLGKDELRTLVVESPSVLTYRKDNLVSKINFFNRLMGYSIAECRELLLAEPRLLRCGVATSLVPTMRFFVRDVQIPLDRLREVVQNNPRILLYSLDDNLIPKIINFLILTLQMNLVQVQKLLVAYPQFLDYNLDRHTFPIATYLMNDLEYSPNEMAAILLKFPRLVTYQLARIKNRVGYLRYELGLSASQVKRVLYQNPQLVGLSFDNLRGRVEFLQESLQLSVSELQTVVAGMPTLLVLNPRTNLQPKLTYLLESFDGRNESVREAVVRLPTLLGYSLGKRIEPRMERILKSGLDPSSITIGIPMKEDRFANWLERRTIKQRRKSQGQLAIVRFDGGRSSEGSEGVQVLNGAPGAPLTTTTEGVVHWTRARRPLQ